LEGISGDRAKSQKVTAKALLGEINLSQGSITNLMYKIDSEIIDQNNHMIAIDSRKEGINLKNFLS